MNEDVACPDSDSGDAPTVPKRPNVYLGALTAALAGTLLTSVLEYVGVLVQSPAHAVPGRLYLATFGRIALTHACVVLPMLLVLSLLVSAAVMRNPTRRVEPWHAVCFVLVAGIVVIYADVVQIRALHDRQWKHAFIAVPILAAPLVFLLVRWICRTKARRWYRGVLAALAAICVLAVPNAPILMFGTPLAGPDAYWLSTASREGDRAATRPEDAQPSSRRPNVLFIVLDTVRADHLSFHGYPIRDTCPFLSGLADKSVTFDRALAPGIWTLPSHASMFTGLSVREHMTTYGHWWLEDRFETLAERAAPRGYRTVYFTNNAFIDRGFNLPQGFEQVRSVWATSTLYSSFADFWMEQLGLRPPARWFEHDNGSAMTAYLMTRWLEHRYDPAEHHLLFINYLEAHHDYLPPLRYRKQFMDDASLERSYELDRQYRTLLHRAGGIRYALDPECMPAADAQVYQALYDLAIRYLDDRLRELFALLDRHGFLDNAVVIITSDHGEALGDHGTWGHYALVHDALIRVPLLVYLPGGDSVGQRVRRPVSTAGIFDAICAAVCAEQRPDAATLIKAITDYRGGGPVVSEQQRIRPGCARVGRERGLQMHRHPMLQTFRAVCDSKYKYVVASDGSEVLFDVQADPAETYNLIDAEPQVAAALREFLAGWLERTPPYVPAGGPEGQPSDRELHQIRSLGYVGS